MSLDINLTGVEKTSNKKTTLTDNSDTFYPTQKAVKTAVDAKFNTPTGTTAQYLRGDGSLDTFPTIPDVTGLQSKAVVVSTNQTAVNDASYTVVANATFTDPSPVEGKGYRVFVRNGTATINSVGYTVGTSILRLFHSGAWVSYVSLPDSNFVPTTRNITINGTTQDLSTDRTFTVGNPFPLFGAGLTSVPGAATPTTRFLVFLSLTPVAAENQRQIPIPYDVTFKNFFCYFGVGASQPASGSLVLTIRKNGVDTAITLTIPAGTSTGTFSDTTNSVSFVAGDLISVEAVNNALATSGNITAISLGTI
jgi:hypothetical protein